MLPQLLRQGARGAAAGAGPPDAAGWRTLTLPFISPTVARAWLLGLGPLVEVLEPRELRASLVELALETAAFYGREPAGSPVRAGDGRATNDARRA